MSVAKAIDTVPPEMWRMQPTNMTLSMLHRPHTYEPVLRGYSEAKLKYCGRDNQKDFPLPDSVLIMQKEY